MRIQITLSNIWTRATVSISYPDKHYTTSWSLSVDKHFLTKVKTNIKSKTITWINYLKAYGRIPYYVEY